MKTETKFRRQWDRSYKGRPSEIEFGKSVTVPDLNLTIKQLMERHTRGVGGNVTEREAIYLDDYGMEVPVVRDLTDLSDMKDNLKDRADALGKQLQKERDERLAKQKQKEEAEKQKTASEPPKTPPKEE